MNTQRMIHFPDGYGIQFTLHVDGYVVIKCFDAVGWSHFIFHKWYGSKWPVKLIHKALPKALRKLDVRRGLVKKFREEFIPEVEAVCEVTKIMAELEAEGF